MSGWIKISRKINEHWLWKDAEKFQWWIDLLLMAAWKDKKEMHDSHLIKIKKGQMIISISDLCKRWNKSKPTVISFLKTLQEDGMIKRETLYRQTPLLTICNYERYQSKTDSIADTLLDALVDALVDTPYNIKNNKEDNEEDNKEANASTSSCDDSAIDFNKLMSYWNDKMTNKAIPRIKSMSKKRKSMVNARIQEYGKRAVFDVINYTSESLFLNGGGDKGAVFDFDWVFRPNNFLKVLEGNYNIKRTNNGAVKTNNSQEQRLSAVSDRISQLLAEDGNS